MDSIAGHDDEFWLQKIQHMNIFYHCFHRIRFGRIQNEFRTIGNISVIHQNVIEIILVVFGEMTLIHFNKKIGRRQRSHSSKNTKKFFHTFSSLVSRLFQFIPLADTL